MKGDKFLKGIWKVIVAVFLLLPLIVTFVYSFAERWIYILPEGFTLNYYELISL